MADSWLALCGCLKTPLMGPDILSSASTRTKMPKGPKGQKRPADVIGNAVRVMEIATGQAEEE